MSVLRRASGEALWCTVVRAPYRRGWWVGHRAQAAPERAETTTRPLTQSPARWSPLPPIRASPLGPPSTRFPLGALPLGPLIPPSPRHIPPSLSHSRVLILKRLLPGAMRSGLREVHFGQRTRGMPGVARFVDAFEAQSQLWLVFLDEGAVKTGERSTGGVDRSWRGWRADPRVLAAALAHLLHAGGPCKGVCEERMGSKGMEGVGVAMLGLRWLQGEGSASQRAKLWRAGERHATVAGAEPADACVRTCVGTLRDGGPPNRVCTRPSASPLFGAQAAPCTHCSTRLSRLRTGR